MGLMLVAYEHNKDWDKLEEMARIAIEKRMRPTHRGQNVSPTTALANALFNGGKQALAQQNYEKAVSKLGEFTGSFRRDPRRDDGLYHLGLAHHGNAQYVSAINTMQTLVEEYPRSRFKADAMYRGGTWAIASAMEEQAIFFLQGFCNEFKRDERYPGLRDLLVELYLGRELYAQAAGILKSEAEANTNSRDERLRLALAWLDTEQRYGTPHRASQASLLVEQISTPAHASERALSLIARIRILSEQQKYNDVAPLVSRLRQLPQHDMEVREAIGEAYFILAESEAAKWNPDVYSFSLKNPLATMNQHYSHYNRTKNAYEQVCAVSNSGWCAAAQFRLARFSEDAISLFEDFSIAETLAAQDVSEFRNRKEAILLGLTTVIQRSDARANSAISQGGVKPNWTQQILWSNASDWDSYRITDETGHGYLQWQPVVSSDR